MIFVLMKKKKSITNYIGIVESNSKRIVTIRDCSKKELGLLYDRHKINKRLSQELLSCTINYEGEQ